MFNIKRFVDGAMLTHRVSFLTLCVSCARVIHRRQIKVAPLSQTEESHGQKGS